MQDPPCGRVSVSLASRAHVGWTSAEQSLCFEAPAILGLFPACCADRTYHRNKQAQRHEATCPRSHHLEVGERGLESNLFATTAHQLPSIPGDNRCFQKTNLSSCPVQPCPRPLLSHLSAQPRPLGLGAAALNLPRAPPSPPAPCRSVLHTDHFSKSESSRTAHH